MDENQKPRVALGIVLAGLLAGLAFAIGYLFPRGAADLPKPDAPGSWLAGDTGQKLEQLAKQHRGLDVAMVETGYRYTELYFAGKDKNWELAQYHLEKIKTAIEYGYERRPARKANADALFLAYPYEQALKAIKAKDVERFDASFKDLTASCNQCHQAEKVPFMKVVEPRERIAPLASSP